MYRQSEKNLLSSNISSTCPHNMVKFGPLAAEIVSLVLGTPRNFNGFRVLAALLHGTLVMGVSQTLSLNRWRHLYSAGWPSRWALAHILVSIRLSFFSNGTKLYCLVTDIGSEQLAQSCAPIRSRTRDLLIASPMSQWPAQNSKWLLISCKVVYSFRKDLKIYQSVASGGMCFEPATVWVNGL